MSTLDGLIVVINNSRQDANNLKQLIEFMDEPEVCTATPGDWRSTLGQRRLGAVFVGADISDGDIRNLISDIGEFDPNVPIVMLSEADNP